jgi:hypothetical protein
LGRGSREDHRNVLHSRDQHEVIYEIEAADVQGREPRAKITRRSFLDAAARADLAADACGALRVALKLATAAEAVALIPRIRYALKSAEGAKRHAHLRTVRGH